MDMEKLGESLSDLQSYKVFKVSQSCQSLSKFVKVMQTILKNLIIFNKI